MNPKSKIRNSKLQKLPPLLLDWFAREARDLPWRRTRDPYAIWVSEIMLQQTQVKTVIPYWERWMRELPTIEALARAKPEKIHKLWEGLGYYTRVRNMQKAAGQIMEVGRQKAEGRNKSEPPHVVSYKFPCEFEDVLALPGIGRYTAGAICSIAFNQPTPILDGNVIRVLTRIFGIAENPREKKTNEQLWDLATGLVHHASRIVHPASCSHLNQSLMELGALVCTPKNPRCHICPVKRHCTALKDGRIDALPNLGKRTAATARHFVAFVVERDGKFLVRQRPAGIVNAHLWEFPNLEVNGAGASPTELFREHFAVEPLQVQPLHTVKHSITRYRITLEAFHVRTSKTPATPSGTWLPSSGFGALAFTAAHKKLASLAANRMLSGR